MYTLDTNAIIYYLKNDSAVVSAMRQIMAGGSTIYISAITEIELFSFSDLTELESEEIELVLRTLAIIPLDSRIARTAGFLRSNYRLKIADSAIAATALFTGTTLVTRNVQDFKKIQELKVRKV